MSGKGKTVCVTGASGYVASWLIKLLLQRGYTVRATLRDPSDPKKSEHLLGLEGAAERLHLFKAGLLEEGSFDTVINGCDGVFHTASPVIIDVKDVQAELIAPAVNGTLNVLRSCAKSSSVKRVVVTSSMAAVTHNGQELPADAVVDETMFSTSEFCQQSKLWYHLSKTLAEEAAWKFARDHGIDMVVLHPGFVIGALLQPKLNGSSTVLLSLINGSSTLPNRSLRVIDVKDVAKAHILAYEVPSASGRYCLVERVIPYSEAVEIIQKYYPSRMVADNICPNDISSQSEHEVSKDKARSLGLDFTPFEQSIQEAIESFKEKGFLI